METSEGEQKAIAAIGRSNCMRKYVLCLCPRGSLPCKVDTFLAGYMPMCEWIPAYNLPQCIILCTFMCMDETDEFFSKKLPDTLELFLAQNSWPEKICLRPGDLQNNNLPLTVYQNQESLRIFAYMFVRYITTISGTRTINSDFHLTFTCTSQSQAPLFELREVLPELELDIGEWDISLYSKDARILDSEVYCVKHGYQPHARRPYELQVCEGDHVYANRENVAIAESTNGFVEVVSKSSDRQGRIPVVCIEHHEKFHQWHLHKSIPILGPTGMPVYAKVVKSNTIRRRTISASSILLPPVSESSQESEKLWGQQVKSGQQTSAGASSSKQLELLDEGGQMFESPKSPIYEDLPESLNNRLLPNISKHKNMPKSPKNEKLHNLLKSPITDLFKSASSSKQLDEGGHKFKSPKSSNKDLPESLKGKPLPNIPKLEKFPSSLKSPIKDLFKSSKDKTFPKSPEHKKLPKNPKHEKLSKSPEQENVYERLFLQKTKEPQPDSELEDKFESHTFLFSKDIPSRTDVPSVSKGNARKLIIVSNGECLDSAFPHWKDDCFNARDRYRQRDSNMPLVLPDRSGSKKQSFENDPPLTTVGRVQAFLLGDSMRREKFSIHHVFSAPSLRCIQTAHNILKGMGLSQCLKIKIEPKIHEFTKSIDSPCMTNQELIKAGFNIDETYNSISYEGNLNFFKIREDVSSFYLRIGTITSMLTDSLRDGGNILIVGDKGTVDACCRDLGTSIPRTFVEYKAKMKKVPYCAFRCQREEENGHWVRVPETFTTPTHLSNTIAPTLSTLV